MGITRDRSVVHPQRFNLQLLYGMAPLRRGFPTTPALIELIHQVAAVSRNCRLPLCLAQGSRKIQVADLCEVGVTEREGRLALEARIRAAQGVQTDAPAPPAALPGAIPPSPAPANNEPSDAWIRAKIVDQIKRDRTGEELGDWIDQVSPEIVEQLKVLSPDQIIEWLKADPILAEAGHHPRLRQTITELLEYANSAPDEFRAS